MLRRYVALLVLSVGLVACGSVERYPEVSLETEKVGKVASSNIKAQKRKCMEIDMRGGLKIIDDDGWGGGYDVGKYSASHRIVLCKGDPAVQRWNIHKHGDEMRGEIHIIAYWIHPQNPDDLTVQIDVKTLMFEGWSPDTDDLDAKGSFSRILVGWDYKRFELKLKSTEFWDDSAIELDGSIRSTVYDN